MRSILRIVSLATALSAIVALFGVAEPVARAGGSFRWNASERCFMKKINKARAKNGLKRLRRDKQVGYVAKRHARKMAKAESMWHDEELGSRITNWSALAQNSGYGGKCKGLFKAFMDSPVHAENILGDYRYFGVGARWKNNRLYVQQVFESKKNPGNVYHSP
jgi:uncharacterized protein YkwD